MGGLGRTPSILDRASVERERNEGETSSDGTGRASESAEGENSDRAEVRTRLNAILGCGV